MANLNKETKAVLGDASKKIGTYKESTGGGDPLHKGEKFKVANSTEEAEKMREADPNTKVRVNQPRNDDGTFGYNSQNARKLKYGPSRGTTVPDFLKGVDLTFLEKGTVMRMEGENGIKSVISTISMSKEQLIENCKHYIESTQGFAGLHEGMTVDKKGRPSKAEKDMKGVGIVPGKKVDISKLAEKTQQSIEDNLELYKQVEQALAGLDAADLGSNTWGATNYNKAGVTEQQLKDRKDWRQIKKEQQSAPKINKNIFNNKPAPQPANKDLVSVNSGAPSTIENKKFSAPVQNKPIEKKNMDSLLGVENSPNKQFSYESISKDPKQFVQENAGILKKIKAEKNVSVKDIIKAIKDKGITDANQLKQEFLG